MIINISKGKQLTLPLEIRKLFHLDCGSKLELKIEKNQIILSPTTSEVEMMFLKSKKIKPRHKLSINAMEDLNERVFR